MEKNKKEVSEVFSEKEYISMMLNEYGRTRDRVDKLVDSIDDDFKYFGVASPLLLGFGALYSNLSGTPYLPKGTDLSLILLIFFIAILLVYTTLAFRDYKRAVLVNSTLYSLWILERQICKLLTQHGFNSAKYDIRYVQDWVDKFEHKYVRIANVFTFFLVLPLVLVPTIVLFYISGKWDYALIYLLLSMLIFAVYIVIGQSTFTRFTNLFDLSDTKESSDEQSKENG